MVNRILDWLLGLFSARTAPGAASAATGAVGQGCNVLVVEPAYAGAATAPWAADVYR